MSQIIVVDAELQMLVYESKIRSVNTGKQLFDRIPNL